ncbi:hypothetical protein JHK84_048217 [Glycine max]|nr:hypothetical protein JHK84_048217 [Glycine max]
MMQLTEAGSFRRLFLSLTLNLPLLTTSLHTDAAKSSFLRNPFVSSGFLLPPCRSPSTMTLWCSSSSPTSSARTSPPPTTLRVFVMKRAIAVVLRVFDKYPDAVRVCFKHLDDYKAYKEAKLAQMKLLNYASCSPVDQNVPVAEPEFNRGGEEVAEAEPELNVDERVEPKNPRWAVYGRGLEENTRLGSCYFMNVDVVSLPDKWLPQHTLAACGEFYLLDYLLKHNVDINVLKNEESGPLKESTSLIEHRKQHGLYYLPSEKSEIVSDEYPPANDPKSNNNIKFYFDDLYQALPIFLNSLVHPAAAILILVILIFMFGEILPQAICTRYGLTVGATLAPLVCVLLIVFFLFSYPIRKVLDWMLGKGHAALLKTAELKTFVNFHGNELLMGAESLGLGMVVGKLDLYVAAAGINPQRVAI